jgi:tRNA (guanine37-N1)-methyltransferase
MAISLVGSGKKFVAIFHSPKGDKSRDSEIVKEIVRHNPNVKSVLKAYTITSGRHRLQKKKLVWGSKETEVVHREYGYSLKVDPRKVYFSPKEAEIRQHVAARVKPKETVMVMFAGVGAYPVAICKKQPRVGQVMASEINPAAYAYMRENIAINKIYDERILAKKGDSSKVFRSSYGKVDRVVMPMVPAKNYVKTATNFLKRRGVVDIYMVTNEREMFKDCERFLEREFKKLKLKYKIVERRKISLYAPHKWKVLYEIRVIKK